MSLFREQLDLSLARLGQVIAQECSERFRFDFFHFTLDDHAVRRADDWTADAAAAFSAGSEFARTCFAAAAV